MVATAGSEAELVRRARAGDRGAFEGIVRCHQDQIYRLSLRMLGDAWDAEEAAQDTFVQAWRRLGGFRAEASLSTWLYRIATNRCLNMLRARPPVEPVGGPEVGAVEGPDHIVEVRSEVASLRVAIRELSTDQRAVLLLRESEGCSYAEIGAILGISVAAVKSRLHRARVCLIDAMAAWA